MRRFLVKVGKTIIGAIAGVAILAYLFWPLFVLGPIMGEATFIGFIAWLLGGGWLLCAACWKLQDWLPD